MQKTALLSRVDQGGFYMLPTGDGLMENPPQSLRQIFKTLLIMKLTILILCFGLLNAQARGYAQTITFAGKNVLLTKLFNTIEEQTGYTVFANKDLLKGTKPVSVSVKDMPLKAFLDLAFRDQPVNYEINNKTIFIKRKASIAAGNLTTSDQSVSSTRGPDIEKIKGTIVNTEGQPLEGATIVVKGTTTSTVSGAGGAFEINAGLTQTLVISYVGYTTQEEPINGRTTLRIVLKGQVAEVEQVVITALGIPKKTKALTYNVQEVKGDEVTRVKDANFINSLAGKVAGVTINSSSSGIGGSSRVVLRGTKSLNQYSNNALYVVDGIPLPQLQSGQPNDVFSGAGQTGDGISNINPEDIESISVLTGPSAAALYGSQAANGVILVTTKKGSRDGAAVTVSNSSFFYKPFVLPSFQNEYGSETGSYYSWGEKLKTPTDYDPKDFFQTGTNQINTVTLSTGSERNQTYVSLGAVNGRGIIHNNNLDRYNFSFRNSSKFGKDKFTMDLSMMYAKLDEQNMLAQGQYFNPLIPIYLFPRGDDIRKYQTFERYNPSRNFQTQYWPFGDLGFQMQNPYWITERDFFNNDKHRVLMSAALKYDINSWINISGRARYDRNTALNEKKYNASTSGLFAGEAGSYYRYNINSQQIYADALLNINKNIKDFSISANVGGIFQDVTMNNSSIGGQLQSVPNLFSYTNINLSTATLLASSDRVQTQSAVADAQVGYKGLVFLNATARRDWASPLANTEHESFFYPSVGVSGILSDIFHIRSKAVSFLKLRVSASGVGNPPPSHISIKTYPNNNGFPQTNTYLPATNLAPEKTKSYEAGINIGLFRNKLKIDATAYKSSTYNQLFNPTLSPSSGYSSFYVNAGQIDNKGIELSASYSHDFGKLAWTSNFIYSLNRNKIVKLLPAYNNPLTGETVSLDSLDMGGTTSYKMILVTGGSMGDVYVNTLKQDEHGYIWVNSASFNVYPDQTHYVKAGNSNPDYNLGFRNSFSYKGFDLNLLVNARVGGVTVSVTQAVMDAFGVSEASAQARNDGGAKINGYYLPAQSYYQTVGGGTSGIGSMYVYSATNVRLGEASLSYSLPVNNYFKWVKGLDLSLIGRNLIMFYNKAPFDPESTANTGTYYQGVDYFMQPSLRSLGFSVRLRF